MKKQKLGGSPCQIFLHFSPLLKKLIFIFEKKKKLAEALLNFFTYLSIFKNLFGERKSKNLVGAPVEIFYTSPLRSCSSCMKKRKSLRKLLSNFFIY